MLDLVLGSGVWIIVFTCPVAWIGLILRYRQTGRIINLSMLLPVTYTFILWFAVIIVREQANNSDWLYLFQVPTRWLVVIWVVTLTVSIWGEYYAYRRIQREFNYDES